KKKKLDLKSTTSFNQTELEVGNSADYKSADSGFINLNTSIVEAVAVMPQIAYSNGLTEANTVPKAVEVSFAKPSATTDATCNVNACCMYKAASKAVTVTLKGSLMAEFDERFANTWENDTYELIVCKVNAANQQGNAVVLKANTTVLDSKAVSIKLAGGYRFSYNTTVSLAKGQSFFLAIRPTVTDVNRVRFKESNSSAIISTGTSHWADMQKKINIHPMSLYLIGDFEQGVNSNGGFLGDVWGGYLDHYTTLAYDLITSDSTHIKSSQVEYGIFATGATKYMGDIGCIVKQVSETTVIKLQTSFTLTAVEVDYFGNKIVYNPSVHKAKKEVVAMILKNGKIERLVTLYTIANDSTLDNINIDTNITLQNGESLGVALHGEPLSAWPPWFYKITNLTARIKLNAESTQPIEVDGFPIYEALERAAQIALNINYPIYSEFYGRTNISYNANGDKYTTENTKNFVHLISGLSLRGMPLYSKQNSYNTTLEDMLQMSKAINNTGYGFETIGGREVLRIEHISHFFPEAPTDYI
ncbi:MAG: hypothetical protein GY951_02670, partial [Psychromonas sp.]|nr:hypothetical protein [Psychromonas sp.]